MAVDGWNGQLNLEIANGNKKGMAMAGWNGQLNQEIANGNKKDWQWMDAMVNSIWKQQME